MATVKAFAALSSKTPLVPYTFDRREPGEHDVLIEIAYCGVCHSDIHQARDEWGGSIFPMVPGHEMVGHVKKVGSAVTKFKVGDRAGVGCMVDSCRTCDECKAGEEQYCNKTVWSYNSRHPNGEVAQGGYSQAIVVDEKYTVRVPEGLDLAAAAPLLCAGITTYSPLRHWKVTPGQRVGVVGLGGLGHMGVKLAAAMGAEVTVFTTSPKKRDDALRLGAKHVIVSTDAEAMKAAEGTLHFILDTVSGEHVIPLKQLRKFGTVCMVGLPEHEIPVHMSGVVFGRRQLAGSQIGGIAETQEMLDFCAQHGIVSDIEMINASYINEAYTRVIKSDVKYRFVIDIKSLSQ